MSAEPFERPILTVDVVLLVLVEGKLKVAVMQRTQAPFEGRLALPGGFVHTDADEDSRASAMRMLRAKLGIVPNHLEEAFVASGAHRDPRGWSASVVYLALQHPLAIQGLMAAGEVRLLNIDALPELAFDHNALVAQAVEKLKIKAHYSSLAAHLLPPQFTLPQFIAAFQVVTGRAQNSGNLRRKFLDTGAFVETQVIHDPTKASRPAQFYRLRDPIVYFDRLIIS